MGESISGRVLVTGAGGCLGRALVAELLARGAAVRGVDLPGVIPPVVSERLEWAWADLRDPAGHAGLVEDTWAVVDAAGAGSAGLHRAASAAGVKRFVSLDAGDRLPNGTGLRTSLLRLGQVVGPHARSPLAGLAAAAALAGRLPRWIRLRGGPASNPIHTRDAARAALHVLASEHPDGARFNVAHPDRVELGELLAIALNAAGGRKPGGVTLPYPERAARLLARPAPRRALNAAAGVAWAAFRRRHKLPAHLPLELPGPETFEVLDVEPLNALGFSWSFPSVASAWEDAVAWYRANGWLP